MALRPRKRLTVPQVIKARRMYFRDLDSLTYIADVFNVSRGLAQKAVHGMGKFYGSIEDDITQEEKDNRIPSRQQFSRSEWRNLGKMQEAESAASAARYRREAEEREAKQKAEQEEMRRQIREKYGKKNK